MPENLGEATPEEYEKRWRACQVLFRATNYETGHPRAVTAEQVKEAEDVLIAAGCKTKEERDKCVEGWFMYG